MSERGGYRPNAGRKPKAIELHTSTMCKEVLSSLYGGEKEALIAVWNMAEPNLRKFILEHAFGKPTDKIEMNANVTQQPYDLSKVSTESLKELLNAAIATDNASTS